MTEHEAKNILDFLARRAGCLEVDIKYPCGYSNGIIGCICNDGSYTFRVLKIDHMFGKTIFLMNCSYVECLRKIFKKSKEGHIIKIYAWPRPFLEACMNLDIIKVEMDLENVFN